MFNIEGPSIPSRGASSESSAWSDIYSSIEVLRYVVLRSREGSLIAFQAGI